MNIDIVEATPQAYSLHTAVLLYGAQSTTIAVEHPVVKSDKGLSLGEGSFVTAAFVKQLMNLCGERNLTYVPENVIAVSLSAVAWWEPAQMRTMYFSDRETGTKAFDGKLLPHPALLFVATANNLSVYALAKSERPNANTKLFCAPYYNVFEHHNVCIGSMRLPKTLNPSDTAKWSAAFFNSNFTHLSSSKRWARGCTYAELLAVMAERKSFDPEWLLPAKRTVEQALCGR